MRSPEPYEYPNSRYFAEYLNFEADENLIELLQTQQKQVLHIYQNLAKGQENFAYAAGKWSLKQLIGHLIDTERIFTYRALAISRGELQALPGYDEDAYQSLAQYESQDFADVLAQYQHVRQASISLMQSFSPNQVNQIGNANGHNVSVCAICWMIAGHEKHHLSIINERYLPHFL